MEHESCDECVREVQEKILIHKSSHGNDKNTEMNLIPHATQRLDKGVVFAVIFHFFAERMKGTHANDFTPIYKVIKLHGILHN